MFLLDYHITATDDGDALVLPMATMMAMLCGSNQTTMVRLCGSRRWRRRWYRRAVLCSHGLYSATPSMAGRDERYSATPSMAVSRWTIFHDAFNDRSRCRIIRDAFNGRVAIEDLYLHEDQPF